jgi:hypothetical protein
MSHPSKEDGKTLKRGTDACPTLGQGGTVTSGQRGVSSQSHPAPRTIPAAVPPSRALQHHPQHCGSPGRQDITTPAIVRFPALRQPNPRAGVRTTTKQEGSHATTLEAAPGRAQDSLRRPARRKIRQDGHQLHDVVHYTATCSLELCVTIVNRLPLAYKRRRQSPSRVGNDG